jgi:hypothetical protein
LIEEATNPSHNSSAIGNAKIANAVGQAKPLIAFLVTQGGQHNNRMIRSQRGRTKAGREHRPAEATASDHRHRGARGTLQLAGYLVRLGQRHVAKLLHRLAAATHGDRDAHMRMHLDLIGPEVQHHGTDFAAEGGADRHREWGEGHRPQARCRPRGKGRLRPGLTLAVALVLGIVGRPRRVAGAGCTSAI